MAKDKTNKELNMRGGMVSSADFRSNVIREDVPKMKELFRQRKWTDIPNKKFIIDPFDPLKLTPFSYDLSIGDEVFSCRLERRSSFPLEESEDEAYEVQPGETVIVRTLEYIALPRCYSATVWPRFNFVREGIFQSMVKIDPTWYGQLGVALTNLSPGKYPIWKGKKFATLILYELTQDTDIVLYRSGEILDKSVKVPLKGVQIDKWENKIKEKGLEGKCAITNGELIVSVALTPKEFEKLLRLSESEDWKKAVEKAMRIKTMDALGLPDLDLILAKDPDGQLLTREDVASAKSKCTREALAKMAVERGTPFELIANIPELVKDQVEGQVELEFNKEISGIILRIMALTVSLLGFISLIVAIIAIVARYLQLEFPKEIDVKGTLVVAMMVIVVALVPVLVYVFALLRSPKGIAKVGKELKEINDELRRRLNNVEGSMKEKNEKLWEEVESIKSGMKGVQEKDV